VTLDPLDRRILDALAHDAWLTYAALSDRVGLSASAVQRRVERLIADGVLRGAKAIVDHISLGRPLRLYVLVELRDESSTALRAFTKRLAATPGLVEAHYLAGDADVIIVLQMASMAEYADFAGQLLNGNPNVRRYKTLTSLHPLT
jgi:Lrp/AsnC family leucine-responsive transcriptional regulator